jgi:hypothetical protein
MKFVGIWLVLALVGLLLYLLPAFLKEVAIERFQAVENAIERIDQPEQTEKDEAEEVPSYLQNVPGTFEGATEKSSPASLDLPVSGPSPAEQQGRAMKAPVEGFYSGPSPSSFYSQSYTPSDLDGLLAKLIKEREAMGSIPTGDEMFLKSITTRDGISSDELQLLQYWVQSKPADEIAGTLDKFVLRNPEIGKEYLTLFARNGLPFGNKEEMATSFKKLVTTKSDLSSVAAPPPPATESSKCQKPKATCTKPKAACPIDMRDYIRKDSIPKPKCPSQPDMRNYVRKDSIPCWACKI